MVVNAAGLYADDVSAALGGEPFSIYPVRGEYAELTPAARHLVGRPVYPLPDASGHSLGVHLTRTTWGSVMLGPTASYQQGQETTTRAHASRSRRSTNRHVACCQTSSSTTSAPEAPASGPGPHHRSRPSPTSLCGRDAIVPALVHASGIDSPGLTACLAIGDKVLSLVEEALS